jgi:hypothetical protein
MRSKEGVFHLRRLMLPIMGFGAVKFVGESFPLGGALVSFDDIAIYAMGRGSRVLDFGETGYGKGGSGTAAHLNVLYSRISTGCPVPPTCPTSDRYASQRWLLRRHPPSQETETNDPVRCPGGRCPVQSRCFPPGYNRRKTLLRSEDRQTSTRCCIGRFSLYHLNN